MCYGMNKHELVVEDMLKQPIRRQLRLTYLLSKRQAG
jgi:hypothetical protein